MQENSMNHNPRPLVSVIIACKNTAKHIEACLQSIRLQTYKHIEIIVVDNFSTDGTFELATKNSDLVLQTGPERSTQFNLGLQHATGDFIYRIGPDYVLEPTVIETCVQKINEGFDALALHNMSVGKSIWAKVRYIERESYRNDQVIAAVRFIRRSVLKDIGGLDESLVAGEDFDLHNRIVAAGYKWTHSDATEYHLGEPRTITDVWNKYYYYGKTINRYRKKYPAIAKQQFLFFRPSFKNIQTELWKSPRMFFAFYAYMAIKHAAGVCGMVRSELKNFSSPSYTQHL